MEQRINNFIETLRGNFTKEEAKNMFSKDLEACKKVIEKLEYFEKTLEEEDIVEYIDEIIEYIYNEEMFEDYIEEIISPYCEYGSIGNSIQQEFDRSVKVFYAQLYRIPEGQSFACLTSIQIASSIIQNGLLFVNDVYDTNRDLNDFTTNNIYLRRIYEFFVRVLLVPLKQLLVYITTKQNGLAPMLLISTLGTVSIDMLEYFDDEVINKVKSQLQALPPIDPFRE